MILVVLRRWRLDGSVRTEVLQRCEDRERAILVMNSWCRDLRHDDEVAPSRSRMPWQLLMQIEIDSKSYDVARTLTPNRLIINYEGEFLFADKNSGTGQWELSTLPVESITEEDRLALHQVIQDSGGFDKTSVTVTKDE